MCGDKGSGGGTDVGAHAAGSGTGSGCGGPGVPEHFLCARGPSQEALRTPGKVARSSGSPVISIF